jgi:hypothetical protein
VSKATLPKEEVERQAEEAALTEKLRAVQKRRPEALVMQDDDGEYYLECPFCGNPDDFHYEEDIVNSRAVNGISDDGEQLEVEGYYETEGGDDGDDGRLLCGGCYENLNTPSKLGIDWV